MSEKLTLSSLRLIKKIMKLNYYTIPFLIFIASIIVISCELIDPPGVKYSQKIQNDSDYDIIIHVHGGNIPGSSYYYASTDSFYVNKHSVDTIMFYWEVGETYGFEDCDIYADSLTSEIANNDSLHLKVDLNNQSNWTFNMLHETHGGGGTCECRIIINNNQIE